MSILDNEGHDPNGLGNRPRRDEVDHQSIASHFEREVIRLEAEIERLRAAARLVVDTWDAEDHPVSMPNLRRAIDGLRDTSEQTSRGADHAPTKQST